MRSLDRCIRICVSAAGFVLGIGSAIAQNTPNYNEHVEPLLAKHCIGCHRPGDIGVSFLTYRDARPWAKAMRDAVTNAVMPPWFAEPDKHRWANDRTLNQNEIKTISLWADSGAPEGPAQKKPAVREFAGEWSIGKPDIIFEMPVEFDIPAEGGVDYQYIIVPMNLKEDVWVQAVETKPGNRAGVHHAVFIVRDPGSPWLKDQPVAVPIKIPSAGNHAGVNTLGYFNIFHIYVPGNIPDVWAPGQAKLVRAGSDLVFQMHYVTNGKPYKDRTRIAIRVAREPVRERVLTLASASYGFTIPPGVDNFRVPATLTIPNDAKILRFFPHRHRRGKAIEYTLVRPDSTEEKLIKLPRYDFTWQLTYKLNEPIPVSRGYKVNVVGVYDNSANNPRNPDASKTVLWGEQSWDEMMSGFFDIAIDSRYKLKDWFLGGSLQTPIEKTSTRE